MRIHALAQSLSPYTPIVTSNSILNMIDSSKTPVHFPDDWTLAGCVFHLLFSIILYIFLIIFIYLFSFSKIIIKNKWKGYLYEKTRPTHVLGGWYESPVFSMNLSWLKWSLNLQWVCMGKGFGPARPGNIYIKYLNIESSKFKTVRGVHKSLIRC